MKITPLDIRKQEFKKGFRGYDTVEVQMFLDLAAEELESVVRDRADLAERTKRLEAELGEYREKERLLQSALIAAERVATETRENAHREGELAIKDAELCAERLMGDAQEAVVRLRADLAELQMKRSVFLAKMKSFLQSQLDILEAEMEDGRTQPVEEVRHES
ncbi:MAG: DivIVA domain-containing protein [Candidatus Eisenbacteria sp.]|nr:DivIVA domain-containing protein [Candidatus Eisenbacteria bacterium]